MFIIVFRCPSSSGYIRTQKRTHSHRSFVYIGVFYAQSSLARVWRVAVSSQCCSNPKLRALGPKV